MHDCFQISLNAHIISKKNMLSSQQYQYKNTMLKIIAHKMKLQHIWKILWQHKERENYNYHGCFEGHSGVKK